jgi:hypothetical protein
VHRETGNGHMAVHDATNTEHDATSRGKSVDSVRASLLAWAETQPPEIRRCAERLAGEIKVLNMSQRTEQSGSVQFPDLESVGTERWTIRVRRFTDGRGKTRRIDGGMTRHCRLLVGSEPGPLCSVLKVTVP